MTDTYNVPEIKARLLAKMGEQAQRYPTAIESFSPRILARIAELWGSAAFDPYLDSLMLPERQDRHGFPAAVATELFALSTAHAALGLAPKTSDTSWTVVEESARFDGSSSADK